jgi:hypothetical protein
VPTAITGATLYDGEGARIDNATIVLVDGRVSAVGGADTPIPAGANRIDGAGRWVTPGVIDITATSAIIRAPAWKRMPTATRSPARCVRSLGRAQHLAAGPGLHPRARQWRRDHACTCCRARRICSAGAASRPQRAGRTYQQMRFPGAPRSLKMACGENPKRVYGGRNQMPQTRMGNVALMRQTWQRAVEYRDRVARTRAAPATSRWRRWSTC